MITFERVSSMYPKAFLSSGINNGIECLLFCKKNITSLTLTRTDQLNRGENVAKN